MELSSTGIGRLDYKVRPVAFLFLHAYLGDGVRPLFSGRFFRFGIAETQSALDGFLPLVTSPLDFFKVTGEIVL